MGECRVGWRGYLWCWFVGFWVVLLFGVLLFSLFVVWAVFWFRGSVVTLFWCSAARLFGCSAARLFGCSVVRWFGGSVVRLFGDSAVRLFGGSAVRLCGGAAVRRCGGEGGGGSEGGTRPPGAQPVGFGGRSTATLEGSVLADNGSGGGSDADGDPLSVIALDGEAGDVGMALTTPGGATLQVDANGAPVGRNLLAFQQAQVLGHRSDVARTRARLGLLHAKQLSQVLDVRRIRAHYGLVCPSRSRSRFKWQYLPVIIVSVDFRSNMPRSASNSSPASLVGPTPWMSSMCNSKSTRFSRWK